MHKCTKFKKSTILDKVYRNQWNSLSYIIWFHCHVAGTVLVVPTPLRLRNSFVLLTTIILIFLSLIFCKKNEVIYSCSFLTYHVIHSWWTGYFLLINVGEIESNTRMYKLYYCLIGMSLYTFSETKSVLVYLFHTVIHGRL